MGMFDTIKCEVELPGYDGPMDDFQTKDLDCAMEDYTINKEGKLYLCNVIPTGNEDMEFHGMLNFYTYDRERKCLEEFDAKFTDGYLVEICNVNTGIIKRYDDLNETHSTG